MPRFVFAKSSSGSRTMPKRGRLLGYVPYEGGWARPFAVRQLKEATSIIPSSAGFRRTGSQHLDRGELPAYSVRGQKQVRWLPAQEADRLRSNWKNPWQIATEHFEIQSDVPLGEAIEFARRLEAFYDVFFTLLADLVGENLPLARRFRAPAQTGETSYRPHQVYLFRDQGRVRRAPRALDRRRHRPEPRLLQSAQAG